jgi:DNA primase
MLDLEFYKGRVDGDELLEALGIDAAFHKNQWIMCHCPDWMGNHKNGDANPSFGFNEDEMVYNCFVCGGGDVFQLVEMMLGGDENTTEQFLLSMAHLEPMNNEDFANEIERLMNPMKTMEADPEYPKEALFPFRKIHPYLYERGISKEVIIEHQVGFDEDHYGITIPHTFMGKLKGWQTRHLMQDEQGNYMCPKESCLNKGKVPKYKNTSGFPKQNTLYAYDQTMKWCKENGHGDAIVVESPMTVLYLKSLGFKATMGTFGQFSTEQGHLLWPFNRVYFWPDNDKAGAENTERAIKALEQYVNLQIVPVVPGEKSDAANLETWQEVFEYLEDSEPAVLWNRSKIG